MKVDGRLVLPFFKKEKTIALHFTLVEGVADVACFLLRIGCNP